MMAPPDNTLRRRRQRRVEESDTDTKATASGGNNERVVKAKKRRPPAAIPTTGSKPSSWKWILWMLHALACGMYLYGWILQTSLHTSEECEMTYSQRHLIPIPLSPAAAIRKYRLHKFVDQRDPRPHHRAMLQEWLEIVKKTGHEGTVATQKYLDESQWAVENPRHHCTEDMVAVLFIPGHWGSHMQSRSIGAHGIHLTAARDHRRQQLVVKALADHDWKGTKARSNAGFTFDVYAVDFQHEGSALHAQFLWAQTEFVAHVIRELVDVCQLSQVLLVGHSIGGYVARLAPILHPEIRPYIQNTITLGSPHAHPVFGWESSVHHLHQTYLEEEASDRNEGLLVAISGGIRDEMIPPVACKAPNNPNSLSILSPEIMKPGPNEVAPRFGMDHRALVWCHNLLSVVKNVIFILVREDNQSLSISDRLQVVRAHLRLQDPDYDRALRVHQGKFREVYGFAAAIALEAAMLYHLEILVGLLVVLGSFHCVGTNFVGLHIEMPLLPIVAAIGLAARTDYQIHWLGITLLALVANAIFWTFHWIARIALPFLLSKTTTANRSLRLRRIRFWTAGIFLMALGGQCVGKLFTWQVRLCLAFLLAVYIGTISTAIAITSGHQQSARLTPFAVTFFLLCPFLVAGKITALFSGQPMGNLPAQYQPDRGLLVFLVKLCLPIALRMVYHHSSMVSQRAEEEEILRAMILTLVILYLGPSLFQMGQGYRAGDLLAAVSWLEFFFLPML